MPRCCGAGVAKPLPPAGDRKSGEDDEDDTDDADGADNADDVDDVDNAGDAGDGPDAGAGTRVLPACWNGC